MQYYNSISDMDGCRNSVTYATYLLCITSKVIVTCRKRTKDAATMPVFAVHNLI